MGMSSPKPVGGHRFRFAFREDGTLVPESRNDWEVAADVTVVVQMFQDGDYFYCGEVIVSTNARTSLDPANRVLAEKDSHLAIDSRLWRAVRIGELVAVTSEGIRGEAERVAREVGDEYLRTSVALPAPASSQRGRRSPLTAEMLARVVAPAYRSAVRRPVQAVQAALEADDFKGSGPSGEVTIDQARKAVARARTVGLLPKAQKRSAAE